MRREAWTLPRERTDWLEACHSCTVLASTLGVKNERMQYYVSVDTKLNLLT